jgi:hypothetical protein
VICSKASEESAASFFSVKCKPHKKNCKCEEGGDRKLSGSSSPQFAILYSIISEMHVKRGVFLVRFDYGSGMFLRNPCVLRPDGVTV